MSVPALQLDLPDPEPAGFWLRAAPWIIVLFSGAALPFALLERLQHIPASLGQQALALVGEANAERIEIDVDGRDVTLSGELDHDADRAALVAAVSAIDGVRRVRDELRVVDPAARLDAARTRFRETLAAIDTSGVAFEAGSASFTDGSDAPLAALLELMQTMPTFRVRIAGHTDNTGRAEVNLRLSRERAGAVADHLVTRGIDPSRIIALGYGATQPVADNATVSGRARNRRIEIDYID